MESTEHVNKGESAASVTSKQIKWELAVGNILNCCFPSRTKKSFPLVDLFPNIAKYNDAQLWVCISGVRETLRNGYSSKKNLALTQTDMELSMTATWKRWTTDGKFLSGERANAAIPKVSISAVEEKAKEMQKEMGLTDAQLAKFLARLTEVPAKK